MVSKETLTKLREQLPPGALTKIHKRLLLKGFTLSLSWVIRVMDPDDVAAENEDILMEAIELRDEYLLHKSEIENRILNPEV